MIKRKVPETLAAIDLGTNSFHMVVARVSAGQPVIIDRLREQVQLGAGLDAESILVKSVQRRALKCLARFGQRIRDVAPEGVRAVGTNALRVARNAREFLEAAEQALGHEIEVVSGWEEARLIHLGVSHSLARVQGNRLVIDIGGGSTECILGRGFDTLHARSLPMGCVSYTRRFFEDGSIRRKAFEEAVLTARLELRGVAGPFREKQWTNAVGSSGTIRSVAQVLEAHRGDRAITLDGLQWLQQQLVSAGHMDALEFEGLKRERAPVFPGGVAVLTALFQGLGIDRLSVSSGALREGVMFDLLGRLQQEDVRDRTIRLFQSRFHIDVEQAARVEQTALAFLEQVADTWDLAKPRPARFLSWAARLHEIGLAVSFDQYARHGAYLIENTDMPGLSRDDQTLLAVLVGSHRGKLRRRTFKMLPGRTRAMAKRLTALLRLAVRMHRGRHAKVTPDVAFLAADRGLTLQFPRGWLAKHPLTRRDLQKETGRLQSLGIQLEARSS